MDIFPPFEQIITSWKTLTQLEMLQPVGKIKHWQSNFAFRELFCNICLLGKQQCRQAQKLEEFKSGPVDISCLSSGTPQRIKMCLEKNHEKTWKILHLLRIKSRVKLKNVPGKNDKVLEFVGDPLVTTLSYGFRQIFYNHFKTGDKNDS